MQGRSLHAKAQKIIEKYNLRYVIKTGKYFIWRDNEFIPIEPGDLKRAEPAWDSDLEPVLMHLLDEQDRLHKDLTYSYRDLPTKDWFNMLSRDRWLKPVEGQHHWIFDVLMDTLAGGKSGNREHLERVICYKYLHPEEVRLPCLLIHGEGGVGKNLLVDTVLHRLFDGQTVSLLADNALGKFNTLAKGRAVVLIDESAADQTNRSKVKSLVHNERMICNEKFLPEYVVDNTPLWIIGTNDSEGGIYLDRSDADRRFSVLHIDKGKTLRQAITSRLEKTSTEAQAWMDSVGGQICGDPNEISKWLGYLVNRYKDEPIPHALHGTDFQRLLDVQKPAHEALAEAVFKDPCFTHIERKVLYQGYRLLCQQSGKKAFAENKFNPIISGWLASEGLAIDLKEVWHTQPTRKRRRLWYKKDHPCVDSLIRQDNAAFYIENHEWVGPDPF